jgi:hypothetical protein
LPQSNSLDVMLPSGPFTRTKRAGFHPPRADNWKDQKSTARAKARQGTQGKVLLSTYFPKSFFALRRAVHRPRYLVQPPLGFAPDRPLQSPTQSTHLQLEFFQFLVWSSAIRP